MNTARDPVLFLASDFPGSGELGAVIRRLLDATTASRTTVRIPRPDGQVALVAEARLPSVASMVGAQPPGIREAGTYTYLEETRRLLIQSDCRNGAPKPPQSLVEDLHVYAQMLAPVMIDSIMAATISVHQQDRTREWSAADIRALEVAQAAVRDILEARGRAAAP